ncbi:MAG: rsmI [Rickettsiales bacterium]|jgi:16S rRNA (cytidine1402-2'-O)-methyltransferase|nr:rsmI [Rickettsiales bacterium]
MDIEGHSNANAPRSKLPLGLYIVAVPIGNPKDITLRALEVLTAVEVIACEDTRMTDKLLRHHGIKGRMIPYHDHSSDRELQTILWHLAEGRSVALVSDAGTPLISDPGYKLVREAQAAGYPVTSLPGASSVMTALTLAGLPTDRFLFEGFLANKSGARRTQLEEVAGWPVTLIYFESPRRLVESLEDMVAVLGPSRQATVLRELTKTYEEVRPGTLEELVAIFGSREEVKGEIVIIIEPAKPLVLNEEEVDSLLLKAMEQMSLKDAAAHVASLTQQPKKVIYARALELKKKE